MGVEEKDDAASVMSNAEEDEEASGVKTTLSTLRVLTASMIDLFLYFNVVMSKVEFTKTSRDQGRDSRPTPVHIYIL